MTAPTVSVLIAAYNGAALIGETLASLSAQTRPDWEAIVVDDASTDDTRAIVAAWPDPRVRLVALPANGGPVCARNHALRSARGRLIAALDQDDLCHPERFAQQVAWLDADPGTVLVATATDRIGHRRRGAAPGPRHSSAALVDWLLWIENPLVWSSVMLRADTARSLAPFTRPDRLYAEDFDLYHRLAPTGAIRRIDRPLLTYRCHPEGASQRHAARMIASAALVLAERYAATLGADAPRAAALIATHLMDGQPVSDRATLAAIGAVLVRLHAAHDRQCAPGPADRDAIARETGRRWAGLCRAGLRAGTLTLTDIAGVGATVPSLAPPDAATRIWSRLVGGARPVQTLAAKIIRPGPSRANT